MIRIFQKDGAGAVRPAADCDIALGQSGLVWIDLERPTEAEEAGVESALGIDVPTPDERAAYEESARFYSERGALYLTATLLGRRDDGPFRADAVMFILTADSTLVTVRQINPRAFDIGAGRSSARIAHAEDGRAVFYALLEGCIERIADILMENTAAAHALSSSIFVVEDTRMPDLRHSLLQMGRLGTIAALAQESLSSLHRLVARTESVEARDHKLDVARLRAIRHDIAHLEMDVQAFKNHLAFLQEAMLGMVGATQNNTLKALSLATIVFVPPTLIASVFGMNFEAMTWFKEPWGPMAGFAMMVAAPVVLLIIARWRRWF